jgi:hypothetical protein
MERQLASIPRVSFRGACSAWILENPLNARQRALSQAAPMQAALLPAWFLLSSAAAPLDICRKVAPAMLG